MPSQNDVMRLARQVGIGKTWIFGNAFEKVVKSGWEIDSENALETTLEMMWENALETTLQNGWD